MTPQLRQTMRAALDAAGGDSDDAWARFRALLDQNFDGLRAELASLYEPSGAEMAAFDEAVDAAQGDPGRMVKIIGERWDEREFPSLAEERAQSLSKSVLPKLADMFATEVREWRRRHGGQ